MMRQHKLSFTAISAVLFLITISGSAFADMQTQQIVDRFNSMNSGNGYLFRSVTNNTFFSTSRGTGEDQLVNQGTDMADRSAYTDLTSGLDYFQTFCVNPLQDFIAGQTNAGKLDYNSTNGTTSTKEPPHSLTVGTAWLYKEFVTEGLTGYYEYSYGTNRANSAVELQDAIYYLMGFGERMKVTANNATAWTTNTYLALLDNMSGYNRAFWQATYDPASNYGGLMDDIQVFVMQNSFVQRNPDVTIRQDVLYAIRSGGSDVPEPASLLLWTLGGLGVTSVAYRKRRMNRK